MVLCLNCQLFRSLSYLIVLLFQLNDRVHRTTPAQVPVHFVLCSACIRSYAPSRSKEEGLQEWLPIERLANVHGIGQFAG